jgi:hypothetical protein
MPSGPVSVTSRQQQGAGQCRHPEFTQFYHA